MVRVSIDVESCRGVTTSLRGFVDVQIATAVALVENGKVAPMAKGGNESDYPWMVKGKFAPSTLDDGNTRDSFLVWIQTSNGAIMTELGPALDAELTVGYGAGHR